MEDGYALADKSLRASLRRRYPALMKRCDARRVFLRSVLGFEVGDEVLPLSNMAGLMPVYYLEPQRVPVLAP